MPTSPRVRQTNPVAGPAIVVRRSKVHGLGVFATRAIRKGELIDEYVGERISHGEANWRYRHRDFNDSHTFLFTVSSRTVIDARNHGNDTRYINHRCDPNCEPQIRRGRVFIVAIRAIRPGDELGFEYNIGREDDDPPNVDDIYACRCGARRCRGTILWPPRKPRASGRNSTPRKAAKTTLLAAGNRGRSRKNRQETIFSD